MRAILAVVGLSLMCVAFGQGLSDTHGKTNAQILAMGYDKWYGDYTRIEGETTLGMAGASVTYANALAWRNDKLIAALPKEKQEDMKSLRKLLDRFSDDMMEVGRALSGGGTMWTVFGAGSQVEVEETLYGVLGGDIAPADAMVVSKPSKALDELGKAIDSNEEWYKPFTKKDAWKDFVDSKVSFQHLVERAKKMSRKDSDRILAFCYGRIQVALMK